jgi:hypothetical protein
MASSGYADPTAHQRDCQVIQIEQSIVIHQPVAAVFAFIADPRNDARWNAPIEATTLLTEGPPRVGTTFQHTVRFLGQRFQTRAEITALEPNQRACVRTTSGPLHSTGCRIVAPAEGGTRLTITLVGRVSGPFRLIEAMAAEAARRQLVTALADLKTLLEAQG